MTIEYEVTSDQDAHGDFISITERPEGEGWRLHSHSTCYDTDDQTVRITYVWEREAP